ncbi:MAG: alanyl-tRNA editing protein [Actinomycetota bacterium]|nr:alanyl-tRNA editing protein [Actinomycetota bacterium]
MSVYLCHEQPELVDFEATVVGARPGAVLLSRSALHPGGGGQPADRATITHAGGTVTVETIEVDKGADGDDAWWHILSDPAAELTGDVAVRIDTDQRANVSQLHTGSHILNALVFDRFEGALVTGAQINTDGTGRMDFDLPGADNAILRSLGDELNDIIGQGLEVRTDFVTAEEVAATPGLVRSAAVAPPMSEGGTLRIVEIVGVDRQACGGTHLSNTGQSRPIRIRKVENKGRHNRRIRFEFAD